MTSVLFGVEFGSADARPRAIVGAGVTGTDLDEEMVALSPDTTAFVQVTGSV